MNLQINMKNSGSIGFLALILILAGIVVTLENFSLLNGISLHWPLLPIVTGIGFVILYFNRNRSDTFLNWLGTFMISNGILFYYLNFTTWNRLATEWPLFFLVLGISFLTATILDRKKVYLYSAIGFITLFLIFYLVFSISARLWPLSLFLLGIDLLLIDHFNRKIKSK